MFTPSTAAPRAATWLARAGWRSCAAAVLAPVLLACGAAGGAGQALPPGYQLYSGGSMGFRMGLPPGWVRDGGRTSNAVSFTDPSKTVSVLVHVDQAQSSDLDAAVSVEMFNLTGGNGTSGGSESTTTLAGRPARMVRGTFQPAEVQAAVEVVVTVAGGRAWMLALAGPPDRVRADQAAFDHMRGTFALASPA